MNNLNGEFGFGLAQTRMEEYLREAERAGMVSAVLRERNELAAASRKRSVTARLWRGAIRYVGVVGD